jgi:hypothetical protein
MIFKLRDFKNLKQRKSWQSVISIFIIALFVYGAVAFDSDNFSLNKDVSAWGPPNVVREADDYKVYVVKNTPSGSYKRWIQTPEVLNCYEHLKNDIWVANPGYTDTKLTTWLVRAENDCKVYEINGDMSKHWLNMTAEQFTGSGRNWDMIYIINDCELNLYTTGSQVMSELLGLKSLWLKVDPIFEPINGNWVLISDPASFCEKGYVEEQVKWITLKTPGHLDTWPETSPASITRKNKFPEYFINSVTDTSDWLDYTNDQFGFKFKYPNNMVCIEGEHSVHCKGNTLENITILPRIHINLVEGTPSASLSYIDDVSEFKFGGKTRQIYSIKTTMHSDYSQGKRWRAIFTEFPLGNTDYFVEINYPSYSTWEESQKITEQNQFFDNFFSTFDTLCDGKFSNRIECF